MIPNKKKSQESIESSLQDLVIIDLGYDTLHIKSFEDPKQWSFQLGPLNFLLNPVNRRWLFWDPIHKEWRDTGYFAGEVKFVLNEKQLSIQEVDANILKKSFHTTAKLTSADKPNYTFPIYTNTLIGHERNCDIKLTGNQTALILQHSKGFVFFPLEAKEEIEINEKHVLENGTHLHNNDLIRFGKELFIFHILKDTEREKNIIGVKYCYACGNQLKPGAKFCSKCGTKVQSTFLEKERNKIKFCPYCGAKIKENQKFCTQCGKKLQ